MSGKTRTPLKILTVGLPDWPIFQEYREKGHIIHDRPLLELAEYDLILGPKCWRMEEVLQGFVDLAIQQSQRAKPKPVVVKKKKEKES